MAMEGKSNLKIPLIGLLAVKHRLITPKDLQKGISKCSNAKKPAIALKEYFLSNELISAQNVEKLLRAANVLELRQKELKFGAMAIRKGFINQNALKIALEEQERDIKSNRKVRLVGDILVTNCMLTQEQRDQILKLQNRVKEEAEKTSDGKKDKGDLLEPEIIAGGIKLEISKDFMAAFISKSDCFDEHITLSQIKEALFEKDIIWGIAEDKLIEGFINSSGFKTKSFRVAKGVSPIQGKNARIEFFFNIDYLKAGGLNQDGVIDFKERGEIPFIEEGTVLAEKIPMIDSRRGYNIFGDEIETVPGKDVVLKFGKGTMLSEDGFKILSTVKGYPKYSLSGLISVHKEYLAAGDVDYETGHIEYDGNVIIKGRIKSGFKVKGNDIQAVELDGGIVTAEGDVAIAGGINEGVIYARGNVYARFIHNSEIVCMGDVIIQKEIVDTAIECSGCCVVENGTLISSKVTAKMGVKALNIGTITAGPSVLKVGHDVFAEKELEKNREKIANLKKQIGHHLERKEKLKKEMLNLQEQITELAHVQDRAQLEEKQINSKISSMENDAANAQIIKELKKKIDLLKKNARQAEESLDTCFDKTEKIEEIMEKEDVKIQLLEKRRENFLDERTNLIEWSKGNPGNPVVVVDGVIMPETVIIGKHSEKRVTELIRHAKFMEVLASPAEGQNLNLYEMQVENI